jgi:DNA-binding transcriptional MerR regulator
MLQQILFYRELGLELSQIRATIRRADFEKADALASHREVLQQNLARTRTLMETIDRTIAPLKGATRMAGEQMFEGFSVSAGRDRFDENVKLDGEPHDCKCRRETRMAP